MQNKRGQGLEVSTLILIVLGVIILVLLVLGFSMGWGNLWEKVNIFQGGSSIESVIQGCKVAVSSASTYTYCSDFKKITVNGKIEYVNCEDTRVKTGLSSTLPCANSNQLVIDKCSSLIDAAPLKNNVPDCSGLALVNAQSCTSVSKDLATRCAVPTTTTPTTTKAASCGVYVISQGPPVVNAKMCDLNINPSMKCPNAEQIVDPSLYTTQLSTGQNCCKVDCVVA